MNKIHRSILPKLMYQLQFTKSALSNDGARNGDYINDNHVSFLRGTVNGLEQAIMATHLGLYDTCQEADRASFLTIGKTLTGGI